MASKVYGLKMSKKKLDETDVFLTRKGAEEFLLCDSSLDAVFKGAKKIKVDALTVGRALTFYGCTGFMTHLVHDSPDHVITSEVADVLNETVDYADYSAIEFDELIRLCKAVVIHACIARDDPNVWVDFCEDCNGACRLGKG